MRNCLRISAQKASSFLSRREWSGSGGVLASCAKRLSRNARDAATPVAAVDRKRRRSSIRPPGGADEEGAIVRPHAGKEKIVLLSVPPTPSVCWNHEVKRVKRKMG